MKFDVDENTVFLKRRTPKILRTDEATTTTGM